MGLFFSLHVKCTKGNCLTLNLTNIDMNIFEGPLPFQGTRFLANNFKSANLVTVICQYALTTSTKKAEKQASELLL